jgi:Lipase maturation factor
MSWRHFLTKLASLLPQSGEYALTESVFLRLLGLIYTTTFASFWPQIVGLIGSNGVVPANQFLTALQREQGRLFFRLPTLFWFGMSDKALVVCCIAGCLAGICLTIGFFPRLASAICWVLYLSLVNVGEPFSAFQWDALLLESGFLALFAGAPLLVWAYRFLLFRLMFESGLVKLTSHDPNWRNFHALRYHFMTQPLPNPVAYWTYRLPGRVLDSFTAATFLVELVVPFFLFGPRRIRHFAAGVVIVFQLLIMLTGNYAFFNILTLGLCLWTFEDAAFTRFARWLRKAPLLSLPWLSYLLNCALAVLILLGAFEIVQVVRPMSFAPAAALLSVIAPFEVSNTYGLFAVMTTTRPEIVLEGSDDATEWKEYSFRHKPGDLRRGLPFIAPYQPRLDWQMWFAALGNYEQSTWVSGLMYRLMTGEPSVIGLIEPPPFSKPPKYMRALLYNYDFTTPQERARTGAVWSRTFIGVWYGPVSLKSQ